MAEFSDPACPVGVEAVPPAGAGELSAAVAQCDVVVRATRLARWVGEGRPVTGKGVLRPADVAAVAGVLGIDVPARVRSAADAAALHRTWQVASTLGLLVVDGGRVVPGPVADRWPPSDAGAALQGWLSALEAVCAEASADEDSQAVLLVCRLVLACLAGSDKAVSVDSLCERVPGVNEELPWHERVPGWQAFAGSRDVWQPVEAAVGLLESFGAVTRGRGLAASTDLGRWLLGVLEARRPVPADPRLPAAGLLELVSGGDEEVVAVVAAPWIDARGRDASVRELLRAAQSGSARDRLAALGLVEALDEGALPSLVGKVSGEGWGNLAPYVRTWRAFAMGQEPSEADRRWMVADRVAAGLATAGPAEALAELSEGMGGAGAAEWLAALRGTGHPEAAAVAATLEQHVADHPDAARPVIYQLKITLVGMRPAVWRQVRLVASSTLGTLHDVLGVLFDWDDDHLHVFTVGRRRYSGGFVPLDGARDEESIRLTKALPRPGASIRYVYDLGDEWRHEVSLDRVCRAEPTVRYPVCVGGRGDAPIEDWHPDLAGEDGFDPVGTTPYDVDTLNERLAALAPDA